MFYITTKDRCDWTPGKEYATAEEAERAARKRVKSFGGEVEIVFLPKHALPRSRIDVAVVLRDALDRIWTQVGAAPGQKALL